MLELTNLGLTELSIQEQLEIDGGFFGIFALVCCVIVVAAAIISLL